MPLCLVFLCLGPMTKPVCVQALCDVSFDLHHTSGESSQLCRKAATIAQLVGRRVGGRGHLRRARFI